VITTGRLALTWLKKTRCFTEWGFSIISARPRRLTQG
jgi:hypothetical protein